MDNTQPESTICNEYERYEIELMAGDIANAAISAARCGLAVVPPKEDGSLEPIESRLDLGHERISARRIRAWYSTPRCGLGILTGKESGGLECLRFGSTFTYELFRQGLVEEGLVNVIDRIEAGYMERTSAGEVQLLYRCELVGVSQRLTNLDDRADRITLMGFEDYVVVAPSYGPAVEHGGEHRLLKGGFATIAQISPKERDRLIGYARQFGQTYPDCHSIPALAYHDYDPAVDLMTWEEILEPFGWVKISGPNYLGSATWEHAGCDVSRCHTACNGSWEYLVCSLPTCGFEPGYWYSKNETLWMLRRMNRTFGDQALHHEGGSS